MATEQTPAEIVKEFHANYEAARAANEARIAALEKGQSTAEYDGKIAELEGKMEAYDKLNEKWVKQEVVDKQKAEMDEKIDEMKEQYDGRIDDLKAALNRPALPNGDPAEASEGMKVYNEWMRRDKANLTADQLKTLTIGDDASGGYAAPQEMVSEFIRDLTEHSPLRMLCRVRMTSAKSLCIPKKTGEVRATWAAEVQTRDVHSDAIGLGQELIANDELYARTYISLEMLEDAHFNVEREVRFEYLEQFSLTENDAFMNGDGVRKPEGILTNPNIESISSGSAEGVTFPGLMKLVHSVKTGYHMNSYMLLNRTTLGQIRLLKDGAGQYIFQTGLSGTSGVPNMIAGHRFMEMPNMPDVALNATPVLFGDFMRGYTIADRMMLMITRDPYTRQQNGEVLFVGRRRVGGAVTLAETMKKMVIAA